MRIRRVSGLGAPFALLAAVAGCAPTDELGTVVQGITQCVADGTLPGVDVSSGNGAITWSSVHGAGIQFAFMKATQGTGYTDPRFAANWSGARAAGVLRGAYHFFDPTVDGVAQAHHYLAILGTLAPGDLPPMLDVECPDGDPRCLGYAGGSGDAPAASIRQRMMDWLDTVQSATGRAPVIYTFGSYFRGSGIDTTGLARYPLFLADVSGGACFTSPAPWTRAPFWQYNWHGVIAGIPGEVDLDRFMGTRADLTALANGGAQYAAQYVMQSWPFAAAGPVTMRPGEHLAAYIEMRNTGTRAWDDNTRFATTNPRDRASPLAGPDWVANNRPAAVHGTVAPGGTYRFAFTLVAPGTPGTYDEHFGFVEDHTAWFSDPGQGGPADGVVEMRVVVAGAPVDAGVSRDAGEPADTGVPRDAGEPTDTGVPTDAGMLPDAGGDANSADGTTPPDAPVDDGGPTDGGSVTDGGNPTDGGSVTDAGARADAPVIDGGAVPAGCGCVVPGGDRGMGTRGRGAQAVGVLALVGWRRRRKLSR